MQPITCYVAKRNLSREAWQTDWYNTLTQMFCAHFCLLLSCVLCKYKHGWLRFPSFTSIVTFAVTRQLLWNNVHCVGARPTKPFYLVCYSVFLIVFCFLFFFSSFFYFYFVSSMWFGWISAWFFNLYIVSHFLLLPMFYNNITCECNHLCFLKLLCKLCRCCRWKMWLCATA